MQLINKIKAFFKKGFEIPWKPFGIESWVWVEAIYALVALLIISGDPFNPYLVGGLITGLILFLIFVVYRISWVFNQRKNALLCEPGSYQQLVSMDEMICRFWIWDVKKFIK